MKAFLFCTTTNDNWELCGGSYLVIAKSKEEAESMFELPSYKSEVITEIREIDLSVKGQIEIQESVVE